MSQVARLIGFGGALALLVALASDDVLAQKKDKKGEPKDAENAALPADYVMLQKSKEVVGTVMSIGGGGKTVVLRVDFPKWEPNPNYKAPKDNNPKTGGTPQANQQAQFMKRYQDLLRQQEQAKRAKSPQEQQRMMQKIQYEMVKLQMQMQQQYAYPKDAKNPPKANPNNEPFRMTTIHKDYELELQDNAPIRKMFLAFEYDDLGNIKQYTEKEKAELRGPDKTKPGYKSKLDEVIPGAEAKLFLTPPKAKKKTDDEGVGNVERPTINMIILTKDSPTPGIVGADPKKKKDKK